MNKTHFIPQHLLTINPDKKTFVTEYSDLPKNISPEERFFKEKGEFVAYFAIRSEKTGIEIEFFLFQTDLTYEKELSAHRFRPLDEKYAHLTLIIYND